MSDIKEVITRIVERLKILNETTRTFGDLYDVQPDGSRPNGIVFFEDASSRGVSATISEVAGGKLCLCFDDDGTECIVPREELLGKPN